MDDDELVREVTCEELESAGFEVVCADSGPTALALLDSGGQKDMVISDLSMPEMDGIAVIRQAQRRRFGLPAILLTGFASDAVELATRATDGAAFALVRKPVTLGELMFNMKELLELSPGAVAS